MAKAKKRRKDYPPAQKLAYLDEWKKSGLSAQQFALGQGIKPGAFHRWVRGEGLGTPGRGPAPATAVVAVKPRGRPPGVNGHAVPVPGELMPRMRVSPLQKAKSELDFAYRTLGEMYAHARAGHLNFNMPDDD